MSTETRGAKNPFRSESNLPGTRALILAALLALLSGTPALAAQTGDAQDTPASGGVPAAEDESVLSDSSVDEDALFAEGAFDETVTASAASGEANKLSWLGGATMVLQTTGILYRGTENYQLNGAFSGKAFLKASLPDVAQFFISYSMDHGLLQATNDDAARLGLAARGVELDTPDFNLSELYVSFDVDKVVFLRAGNQILSWGASYFWSPADFVNQAPLDSQSAVDTRAGKPGLRIHVPLPGANLFAFADFSRTIDAYGFTGPLDETFTAAFRADITLSPFNIGVNGNFGFGLPPQVGATMAGSLLGFDVWGEYGMGLPLYDWDFAWAASVGLGRSFGQDDQWDFKAEAFFNGRGADDAELTLASGFTPYYLGKYYVFFSGSKQKLFATGTSLTLSGIANLSDLSFTASASLGLNLPKLIPLSIALRYNGGQDDREFTLRTGGSAWSLSVQSILQL